MEEGLTVGFCIAEIDNTNCVPMGAATPKKEVTLTILPGDKLQTGEPITAVVDVIVQGNDPLPKLYCFGKYTKIISLVNNPIVMLNVIRYCAFDICKNGLSVMIEDTFKLLRVYRTVEQQVIPAM